MITLQGKYNKDCKIFIHDIEEEAYSLILNILNEPASEGVQIRIMPDTHVGKGIVIGFTMPVTNMINPEHIGVDIGCGMLAAKLDIAFESNNYKEIDNAIRSAVPLGTNTHKSPQAVFDIAKLREKIEYFNKKWKEKFGTVYDLPEIGEKYLGNFCKKIGIEERVFYNSIGSLGGGNHFIEVGLDNNNKNWLTFHSGSRNLGLKVCKYHTHTSRLQQNTHTENYAVKLDKIKSTIEDKTKLPEAIKSLKKDFGLGVPKKYLQGENMYNYCIDMITAQMYADLNRETMLNLACKAIGAKVNDKIVAVHNYIDFDDFMIRKGAAAAHYGQRLIIPFNMRDGILICEGKGNNDWNNSAPHGAGRIMSRSKAFENIRLEEFQNSMKGIYSSSVCKSTIDEAPAAYKNAELIEMLIEPTVKIVNRLKPIINIKST